MMLSQAFLFIILLSQQAQGFTTRRRLESPPKDADRFRTRSQGPPRVVVYYQPENYEGIDDEDNESFESLIPKTSFGAEAVPEAQRPVNEFLDVSRQPLFGWAAKESGAQGFVLRLAVTYAIVYAVICFPIAGATYTQDGYLLQKITSANVGAMSLIGVIMIRIYSGWAYIGSRLTSKVIEFEETGWYDGDIEYKTDAEMTRDRFLYKDKVQPVVARVKIFCLAVGGLWLASILAFNVASSSKPMFAQYDPKMLEQLRYDEKLAETAAQSTGGKPSYCDSRYYRAIANGGQGCD